MNKVFIAAAARTPIGSFGGSLLDASPVELGRIAAVEALKRAGFSDPAKAEVDEVIVGNVLGAGHGMNISRQIAIKAGLSQSTSSMTVNKVCGSGLKAVALAATQIAAGEAAVILAGGTESMSQAGYVSMSARWGARMGAAELKDLMIADGLTDAFGGCHMGITAENIAEKYSISRADQDQCALESQIRAKHALDSGHFNDEIVAVPLMKRGKPVGTFSVDEYPRKDATLESLAALKPAFKKDGTVTAGNASGINDGAAMLVCASEAAVKKFNLKPLAEILGSASAGVAPEIMGIGPVEAVKKLLAKTGVSKDQIDLIEANEAFAVQALAVSRLLELDFSKVNVSGGAIALGHPIGASGARVLTTLLYGLKRTGKSVGLATLCIGGGQGIAMLVRRV